MKKQHLLIASFFYICAVLYLATTTPISPHEAKIFYMSEDLVSTLMHWGDDLLGGFIGLRFFFLLSGFLTISLFSSAVNRSVLKYLDIIIYSVLIQIINCLQGRDGTSFHRKCALNNIEIPHLSSTPLRQCSKISPARVLEYTQIKFGDNGQNMI